MPLPPPPLPVVLPNEPASGTSVKLFEKIRKHQVFQNLMRVGKVKESDISLKEIEMRVNEGGEAYRVFDL